MKRHLTLFFFFLLFITLLQGVKIDRRCRVVLNPAVTNFDPTKLDPNVAVR